MAIMLKTIARPRSTHSWELAIDQPNKLSKMWTCTNCGSAVYGLFEPPPSHHVWLDDGVMANIFDCDEITLMQVSCVMEA